MVNHEISLAPVVVSNPHLPELSTAIPCGWQRARNIPVPSSSKSKVLVDQFGRAAEGAAAEQDLNAGMLKDLRSKAKDVYSVAVRGCRMLNSKPRVIDPKEVVHVRLRDKRERVDSNKVARAAAREKKSLKTSGQNQVEGEEN